MESKQSPAWPRIVILGGGTGGTLMANRLHKALPTAAITVVDENDRHVYQPGLLFVPFGLAQPDEIVRPRSASCTTASTYHQSAIDHGRHRRPERCTSPTAASLDYDVLVVATGARPAARGDRGPDRAGMDGAGLHLLRRSKGPRPWPRGWPPSSGGRLVVNVVDMPIKCPVAPLEFCFLADWYFHERGIRDQVEITYVTPLDGAFTKPVASAHPRRACSTEKGIELVTEFNTGEVDGAGGRLVGYDEREVPFDLAVVVPVARRGGLRGPVARPGRRARTSCPPTSTPCSRRRRRTIFAIGDAANLPGLEGRVGHPLRGRGRWSRTSERFLAGEPLDASYDGHANCFIETGFHKALLIDFNYDTEPLAGPLPGRRWACRC